MAKAVGVLNGNFRNGDYYRYRLQLEADAKREALTKERLEIERTLIIECYEIEGEPFWDWYKSDAVPEYGPTLDRIALIEQRISRLRATSEQRSASLNKWMTENWDDIPEIAL